MRRADPADLFVRCRVQRLLRGRHGRLERLDGRQGSRVLGSSGLGDEGRIERGQRVELLLDVGAVIRQQANRAEMAPHAAPTTITTTSVASARERFRRMKPAGYPLPRTIVHVQIRRPRIVVTVQSPEHAANEEVAWRKNDRYFEAVRRHGGDVIVLDEDSGADERAAAFGAMDGLLLSGGADLDPALYGEEPLPTTVVEPAVMRWSRPPSRPPRSAASRCSGSAAACRR